MTIHVIFNTIRSGKTLWLNFMSLVNASRGRAVYTNFHVPYPHRLVSSLWELETMRNGFLAVDDFYMWANSRKFKDNDAVNLVCSMSGKRGIDIAYTTVRPGMVDINVRYNTLFAWVPQVILRDGYPYKLTVRKYLFSPEGRDESEMLSRLVGCYTLKGDLLKYVVESYDTAEEITGLSC